MSRILLHICCAPDATVGFERFRTVGDVVGLFYNPNIEPLSEYKLREGEARTLTDRLKHDYLEDPPDRAAWLSAIAGFEEEPERGERCRRCITHRLEQTAKIATKQQIPAFTTTLTVSPHKDVDFIHHVGGEIAARYGLEYLDETLRRRDGFRRSVELSSQLGLYRQDYCGCRWSLRDRSLRVYDHADSAGI